MKINKLIIRKNTLILQNNRKVMTVQPFAKTLETSKGQNNQSHKSLFQKSKGLPHRSSQSNHKASRKGKDIAPQTFQQEPR